MTAKAAAECLFEFARRAPFNIAPERAHQLAEEIFGSGKWIMTPAEGDASFYAVPEEARICLTYAGLASLWCVAYAAFRIADIASRQQRSTESKDSTHFDIGEYGAAMRLGEHLAYARALFHADSAWPVNLTSPNPGVRADSPEGRVNNVFLGALSWIMLHEIAHVHHKHESLIPANQQIKQEYQADDFATRWILDGSGRGLEREFRALMICVALSWLFLFESEKGHGPTHPPAILRFREAAQHFALGERSVGLENSYYVFKAFFDPLTEPPAFDTPKAAFDWMCQRLGEIFPP